MTEPMATLKDIRPSILDLNSRGQSELIQSVRASRNSYSQTTSFSKAKRMVNKMTTEQKKELFTKLGEEMGNL